MAFWRRKKDPLAGRRGEFEELKREARRAPLPSDRAHLLNLAGDIALELGDDDGAMSVLGEALDVYLYDRDYRAARAIGRKLLRVRSGTVRVRSTLAWLAIAQDLPEDARVALDLYVTSIRTDADRQFAVKHLTAMAEATDDIGLRREIAEHLTGLGHPDAARAITERLAAEADGSLRIPSQEEVHAKWEEALARLVSPARKP